MKNKKRSLIVIIGLFCFATFLRIYALNIDDPKKLINVQKSGEVEHGNYTLTVNDTHPEDVVADDSVMKSNYIARIELESEPGYYVSDLKIRHNNQDLSLGFIAGSEHGAFFRRYDFNISEYLYEFFIPEDATEENKIEVEITYSKKDKINISYQNYIGNIYDENHLFDINNYGEEKFLIGNYMDGDIVLPDDAVSNGSVLKLQFNEENYELFKGNNEDDEIRAEAVIRDNNRDDNVLITSKDACNDEEHYCYVVITKDFNLVSQGKLRFGYNNIKVYVPGYVGFRALGDVNNFNDFNASIGFNNNSLESSVEELFYGTKKLLLYKETPKAVVNDGANNSGNVLDFDNVTGSGYGYTTSYNNDIVTVNISSYYQDVMTLELTLTKNNQNIFDDKVKINLNRFAFNGNLLEVDSIGRNCREANNNNTCQVGIYYSVQYRGVLGAFYTADDVEEEQFNSIMVVDSINGNNINLSNWNQPERAFKRNKDFTPWVLALFYDNNDMIVKTKTFDLNSEINAEGYETKATFNELYNGYNINTEVNKDYIRFDNTNQIPIKNLDYFNFIDNAAIMHEIVLISKDEAREKNIEKVALFLINGEIEDDEIPQLTYGINEGKILYIHHDDNGGNE